MRILLTNDDGIYAPGLRALLPELRKLGEVVVVAPAAEQSAVGHSVTLTTPLIVQPVLGDDGQPMGWAVEGRPADCVKLAIRELLAQPPDLIVSGLNAGSNAGINVLYSGTVAAAIEGAFFRVTSIACSQEYRKLEPINFARGAALSRGVVEQIMQRRPPTGSLFNVNIPSSDKGPIRGVKVLPQNMAPYIEGYDRRTDPRGRVYFWSTPDFNCPDPHPDTDVTALAEGYITVTPLQFNLTDAARLQAMQDWPWAPLVDGVTDITKSQPKE
ncbi:MAG: 5'/3'-nucleotidase SurE [Planctomycetia bacterium]|nr:5'/3'-nucleotidase SurE [Planctomycetia bacterium]